MGISGLIIGVHQIVNPLRLGLLRDITKRPPRCLYNLIPFVCGAKKSEHTRALPRALIFIIMEHSLQFSVSLNRWIHNQNDTTAHVTPQQRQTQTHIYAHSGQITNLSRRGIQAESMAD